MELREIAILVTCAVGVVTLGTALVKVLAMLVTMRSEIDSLKVEVVALRGRLEKVAQMEVKVDSTWNYLMQRAVSEAVEKGVARLNSPVRVSNWAKEWMDSMREELGEIRASFGDQVSDNDLAMEIQRRLGERILKEVCIPHQLWSGACMIIALAVAKEAYRERMGLTDAAKGSGVEGE